MASRRILTTDTTGTADTTVLTTKRMVLQEQVEIPTWQASVRGEVGGVKPDVWWWERCGRVVFSRTQFE
jgi:hypothetical protein